VESQFIATFIYAGGTTFTGDIQDQLYQFPHITMATIGEYMGRIESMEGNMLGTSYQ
jgi:hypothetical protein